MYWFDKTVGLMAGQSRTPWVRYANKDGKVTAEMWYSAEKGEGDQNSPPNVKVGLAVSADYATGEKSTLKFTNVSNSYTEHFTLDTEKTSLPVKAKLEADRVVEEAADISSDYGKLCFFVDYICDAVSYNYDAWYGGASYGDPWQIVYVFDQDETTNVVCEGYSKAFQYLCDQTSFEDAGVYSNMMKGYLNGTSSSSKHMWNLVSYGGKQYFAD
ncbi:MAG: hypothetical protein IJU50_04330, partial [Lachnospiraceae bacterium]|nr:hypothetical protein [Lachnospiraceae bacterium]